jgi:hypothetical protein
VPNTAAILGVFVIGLLMVLTPDPNMIYLLSRTITQGERAGAISLAGVVLGFLVYLTATDRSQPPIPGVGRLVVSDPHRQDETNTCRNRSGPRSIDAKQQQSG